MEKIYNKLVRDKIPEKIKRNNEKPIYHELSDNDYWDSLIEKDIEELEEVKAAKTKEEIKEELADKLELIKAMAEYNNFTLEEIIETANAKREKRGGFSKRLFLEKVITYENEFYINNKKQNN